MVWRAMYLSNALLLTYFLHDFVAELSTVIRMEEFGVAASISENLVKQFVNDLGNTLCILVLEALSPGTLTVVIHAGEDIHVFLNRAVLHVVVYFDQISLQPV